MFFSFLKKSYLRSSFILFNASLIRYTWASFLVLSVSRNFLFISLGSLYLVKQFLNHTLLMFFSSFSISVILSLLNFVLSAMLFFRIWFWFLYQLLIFFYHLLVLIFFYHLLVLIFLYQHMMEPKKIFEHFYCNREFF